MAIYVNEVAGLAKLTARADVGAGYRVRESACGAPRTVCRQACRARATPDHRQWFPSMPPLPATPTVRAKSELEKGRLMAKTGSTTKDPRGDELEVERRAEAPRAVSYDAWSRRDAVQAFGGLPAPDPAELRGKWNGEFVGRPALAWLSRFMFHGWCGKEITDPEHGHNLIRRRGQVMPSLKVKISSGISRFDGRPAVVVSYAETDPAPARVLRGELRWLSPDVELLGLLMIQIGRHLIGPFPFSLRRSQH